MNKTVIKVEHLYKKYSLNRKTHPTLKGTVRQIVHSCWFSKKTKTKKEDAFWALEDVSFEVQKGEVVGIIGQNGAGKSTLLKILSKITYPTKGRIEIDGTLTSLLEVGTGFHPDLTGKENIFLNGSILGLTRKHIQSYFDQIVAFSGIEAFIDMPVKRYSSGMQTRLAFSIVLYLKPQILLIDEVLAVGDAAFQQACFKKIKEITQNKEVTVILVSHNMNDIVRFCDRIITVEQGRIHKISKQTNHAVQTYVEQALARTPKSNAETTHIIPNKIEQSKPTLTTKSDNSAILDRYQSPLPTHDYPPIAFRQKAWHTSESHALFQLHSIALHIKDKANTASIYTQDALEIELCYKVAQSDQQFDIGFLFLDLHFQPFFATTSALTSSSKTFERNCSEPGIYKATCVFPPNFFNRGIVRVEIIIVHNNQTIIVNEVDALLFKILPNEAEKGSFYYNNYPGSLRPLLDWDIQKG